jgi:phenylacetate-coenzyme A ligase PaaK-like adenylate-forming protein
MHVADDSVYLEIVDSDGRPVAPGEDGYSFLVSVRVRDGASFMLQYKIVQDATDHLAIQLVCRAEPEKEELEKLKWVVQDVMGADMRVDFELVANIPREPSGKFRVVENRVRAAVN